MHGTDTEPQCWLSPKEELLSWHSTVNSVWVMADGGEGREQQVQGLKPAQGPFDLFQVGLHSPRLSFELFMFMFLLEEPKLCLIFQSSYKLSLFLFLLSTRVPISLEHTESVNSVPGLTSHCGRLPQREMFSQCPGVPF